MLVLVLLPLYECFGGVCVVLYCCVCGYFGGVNCCYGCACFYGCGCGCVVVVMVEVVADVVVFMVFLLCLVKVFSGGCGGVVNLLVFVIVWACPPFTPVIILCYLPVIIFFSFSVGLLLDS